MTDRPHEPDDPEAGRGSSRVILIGGRDLPDIRHSRGRPPAPPPPPGARPSRGLRPRPRLGGTLLLVVLLPLALLVAVPGWAMTKVDQVDAEPSGMRPADTPGSTYLLVGSDSREGLTPQERRQLHTGNASGSRTDTIMLLYAPTFTGQTLLISLPRDSIVDIPGYGPGHKLNAAFTYGGPELLVHTVENKTGLRIDNFVEVGIGGFVNAVDAVGGVRICPSMDMDDRRAGLHIEAGCQQADGATALAYVRSRHLTDTGDIDRGRRQREVIGQVARKAASPSTLVNPLRSVALSSAGAESLRVGDNVGPVDLARFAWAVRKISGNDAQTCTVPISDLEVHWDTQRASALFDRIATGDTKQLGPRLCSKTGLPRGR
jgi:LCP family protein required for cell wall assembly